VTTAGERPAETVSFRADTLDAAVALAEESLGAPVRVVSANRIRRGGIGGFFAADLGVEVNVTLDDETIEQALERLVSESAVDERARWLEHRAAESPPVTGTRPAATRGLAATGIAATEAVPMRHGSTGAAAPLRQVVDAPRTSDSVARLAQRDEEPSMVRVEQIIEELQFLTQVPVDAPTMPVEPEPRAVVVPTLPPRPSDIARAAAANAAVSQALAVVDEHLLARRAEQSMVPHLAGAPRLPEARALATPSTAALAKPRPPWPAAATVPATTVPATPSIAGDVALAPITSGQTIAESSGQATGRSSDVAIELATEATALSQREVELAVAATDQLIESLQRETGTKRVSVRVVLRTGDQQAVEAEAEWEAS
jgi:hypothetical protein